MHTSQHDNGATSTHAWLHTYTVQAQDTLGLNNRPQSMPAVPVVNTAMGSAGNGCVGLWYTLNLHPLLHDIDRNPQYTTAQRCMPSFQCARKKQHIARSLPQAFRDHTTCQVGQGFVLIGVKQLLGCLITRVSDELRIRVTKPTGHAPRTK